MLYFVRYFDTIYECNIINTVPFQATHLSSNLKFDEYFKALSLPYFTLHIDKLYSPIDVYVTLSQEDRRNSSGRHCYAPIGLRLLEYNKYSKNINKNKKNNIYSEWYLVGESDWGFEKDSTVSFTVYTEGTYRLILYLPTRDEFNLSISKCKIFLSDFNIANTTGMVNMMPKPYTNGVPVIKQIGEIFNDADENEAPLGLQLIMM
eukprot:GHVR01079340.1.p1 GENE.GHVR01079340.1~~GHVR01079340.1.p1  ORF type:complete len:205 (-),score=39.65 GHVR01079340.1:195-809(-)